MIIYVPGYDRKMLVTAIDSNQAILRKNHYVSSYNGRYAIIYRGTIYNGDNIYRSEAGGWAYWARDAKTEQAERVDHDGISWARRA